MQKIPTWYYVWIKVIRHTLIRSWHIICRLHKLLYTGLWDRLPYPALPLGSGNTGSFNGFHSCPSPGVSIRQRQETGRHSNVLLGSLSSLCCSNADGNDGFICISLSGSRCFSILPAALRSWGKSGKTTHYKIKPLTLHQPWKQMGLQHRQLASWIESLISHSGVAGLLSSAANVHQQLWDQQWTF